MASPTPLLLFCNLRYGAAFARFAREDARSSGRRWVVVISARGGRGAPRRREPRLRTWWRGVRLHWRLRLPVRFVEDVNAPDFLESVAPGSIGLVAGFNQVFRPAAIGRFQSLVNVHPSLLPYYRGPTPSHWALERGETRTGYTLHRIVETIDAGEILAQGVVDIAPARDADEVDRRIAEAAVPSVARWIEHVTRGAPWQSSRVDARSVYVRPADYLSFPG